MIFIHIFKERLGAESKLSLRHSLLARKPSLGFVFISHASQSLRSLTIFKLPLYVAVPYTKMQVPEQHEAVSHISSTLSTVYGYSTSFLFLSTLSIFPSDTAWLSIHAIPVQCHSRPPPTWSDSSSSSSEFHIKTRGWIQQDLPTNRAILQNYFWDNALRTQSLSAVLTPTFSILVGEELSILIILLEPLCTSFVHRGKGLSARPAPYPIRDPSRDVRLPV